ncbi:hypothetical protein MLD38_008694 [Melastoma candidum]|uniref:Uncharacterized protein n=1 Tax=Melastoma candidum TaxID=119954 RepID=A0ACB9RY78_9MYRT|nr:hypothetical protein MLD38_008694 [Melastoma candidum]
MGSYYDIDDILSEEEPVTVIFRKPANGVGIDPSAEKNCVEQGSKVELPLWIAHELCQRDAVSVNVPACFDEKTRLEIQADPANVDLRSRSPYFYELGCKMAPITGDRTLCYFLFFAFRSRYKEVLTKAHTAAHVATPKVLSRLTNEEIDLYEAAQSSVAAFKKWRVGGSRFQPSSALGRKRRSTD